MNVLFFILRVVTGLAASGAFILICLVVILRDAASTAEQGAKALGYAATLFATAFTEGTAPAATPWQIGLPQILPAALSLAMLVSVFTPGARWFLHGVAVLAGIVLSGQAHMIFTGLRMENLCLPFLLVWFGYYVMCLFQRGGRAPVLPSPDYGSRPLVRWRDSR